MSAGHGEKKSRKLDAFVAALISHRTVEDAAKSVGISASTAYHWVRDPSVIERLRLARQTAWSSAMDQLQTVAPQAVQALHQMLHEAESESAKLGAAGCILETGLKSGCAHQHRRAAHPAGTSRKISP